MFHDPTHPPARRTAVVAVHSVADQGRGDTAESVAALLASTVAGATTLRHDVLLQVKALEPLCHEREEKLDRFFPKLRRAWKQSWRSDLFTTGTSDSENPDEMGLLYTDYLVSRAAPESAPQGAEVAVVSAMAPRGQADVYEVHWADLSQLGRGVTQILSELATLVFRFARLSTEALALEFADGEARWAKRTLWVRFLVPLPAGFLETRGCYGDARRALRLGGRSRCFPAHKRCCASRLRSVN